MKEEKLLYIEEIWKQESISRAASSLYLSQASLSAALKNAENELGVPLFERSRVGVVPTPEGEEALRLIGEINRLTEKVHSIREVEDPSEYRVPLLMSPSIAHRLILPLFHEFRERESNGMLECRIVSGETVAARIIKNECNIGVTYFTSEEQKQFQNL